METDFVKNDKLSTFVALAFRNGMGYLYLNARVNNANDACISCENFVKFGPVTPELTELAYFVVYVRIYWTDFRNLFTSLKRFTCR